MTASEKAAHEFMRTTKADKVIAIHGNVIARKNAGDDFFEINDCGWGHTPTTRRYLSPMPGVDVKMKQGQLYLNGNEWDGSWRKIEWRKP